MSKKDQDTLDADIDDILGGISDDEKPAPKPTRGGQTKKPDVYDDAFYKNLKPDISNDSDVSDANDVLAGLADMDDLDANLFGTKKSTTPSKEPPKKPLSQEKKPAVEEKKPPIKKDIDFDDDDDPLDFLNTGSSDKSKDSRRMEVERPPTRTGSQRNETTIATRAGSIQQSTSSGSSGKKKSGDDFFDDDDFLDGLGLDSKASDKQKLAFEQMSKEREQISRLKDKLLEEQKSALVDISKERQSLAEEQMQRQRIFTKRERSDIELEAQKMKLMEDQHKLQIDQEHFEKEKAEFDVKVRELLKKEAKLDQALKGLQQRANEVQDFTAIALRMKQEGVEALALSRQKESEHKSRLQQIEAQLVALQTKEKRIAEEQLELARGKQQGGASELCHNCRLPVKDVNVEMDRAPIPLTTQARKLYDRLQSYENDQSQNTIMNISNQMQANRSITLAKIHKKKDEDFLQDERMYLQALQSASYN
ncbi:DgyrCDS7144 [Dimorphilus gyrociliatus]|uniref:DgyrCDS7144 n=1 Tax=Dimorphilus gyrociliatus TaxID=2664684 RepID=A0A7I8VQC8_9ANNE|nr:DgyrCDS7144 [Dimorphilus gyrociliatus]